MIRLSIRPSAIAISDREAFRIAAYSSETNEYLVFYRSLPNQVDILMVIHGSRDIETIFIEQFGL